MTKRNKPARQQPAALTVTHTGVAFSGPLPPPAVLERYDVILPGAAERILAMAEKQADHRRHLEKTVVEGNAKSQARGQWMAFGLTLLVVGVGTVLLWYGKQVEGLGTIIGALASLVTVFVVGKTSAAKERKEKRRELDADRS